jgi:hypothetical protein
MSQQTTIGPGASYPPPPDAAQALSGATVTLGAVAEQIRDVWVGLQASNNSTRYRDMIFDVAQAVRHAAQLADVVAGMVVAHQKYYALKCQPGTPLDDWHEADPFAQPPDATLVVPAIAPAPGDGGAV